MKDKENNGYDYDENLVRGLKRKGLDSKVIEILSRRHEIKISSEEQKVPISAVEESYFIEPSSSRNEGDDDSDVEDDMDPQYTTFLNNLKGNGVSYKLEHTVGKQTLSIMYEGEDDLDDKHEIHSPITPKKVPNLKNVEDEDYQKIGTCSSPRLCNNKVDSTKNKRNKTEKEKDLKNFPKRKVDSPNFLRNAIEFVENARMDSKENSKSKKRKVDVRDTKTGSAKTNEYEDKRSSAEWSSLFGRDWERELDADDVEESYVSFLSCVKIVGDSVVFEAERQKPVTLEALDVDCSSDSEVVETPKDEVQSLRNRERGVESLFRKQLMAKLGEPYDYEEYKELWNEIKLERPKIKHYDLRGARSVQPFHTEELSPSYLSTYAPLKAEVDAVGDDRRRRLSYLRGFFFWLENVAHEDAFEPWLDNACLEVMRKSC